MLAYCNLTFNWAYTDTSVFFYCLDALPEEKAVKIRRREKRIEFSYHKWAHLGLPMLISGGDDTKLFSYSEREFTQFIPHNFCPAPQRPLINLARDSTVNGDSDDACPFC